MVKPTGTPGTPRWFKSLYASPQSEGPGPFPASPMPVGFGQGRAAEPPPCPPMRNMTFAGALADEQEHQRRLVEHRLHLGAERLEKMAAAIGHKLNADQSVAVATDVFFDEDMTRCPVGVKVQLLGAGGVASYGVYNGRDPFWIGWAPVPKRRPR